MEDASLKLVEWTYGCWRMGPSVLEIMDKGRLMRAKEKLER